MDIDGNLMLPQTPRIVKIVQVITEMFKLKHYDQLDFKDIK